MEVSDPRHYLHQIPLFGCLTSADFAKLYRQVKSRKVASGEEIFREGDPADAAYVITAGELEVYYSRNGRDVPVARRHPGDMVGEMGLLKEAKRTASVRALTPGHLLSIAKTDFFHLLNRYPTIMQGVFRTVMTRLEETEALLRQREKMAQLGTLTAGITHELNNPAAAIGRSSRSLPPALSEFLAVSRQLSSPTLTAVDPWTAPATSPAPDTLTASELADDMAGYLSTQSVVLSSDTINNLIQTGLTLADLQALRRSLPPAEFALALTYLSAAHRLRALAREIHTAGAHISDIVKAVKAYSFMDQAPVQSVDIHEGLNNTLMMLQFKLKDGIQVIKTYDPKLPVVEAYGSELNQAWTNLIDNALDALSGRGTLTLKTRREKDTVAVTVQDSGPGIPSDVQAKIFDPFFTTKPLGQGTGLGLHIVYQTIVTKHHGDIKLDSRPGRTRFTISLPLRQP